MSSTNQHEIERFARSMALRIEWELKFRGDTDSKHFHPTHYRVIVRLLEKIMSTQAELAQSLRETTATIHKTNGEIKTVTAKVDTLTAKVAELQAVIDAGGAGTVTQELQDAVAAVSVAAQEVDAELPDEIPVPTP